MQVKILDNLVIYNLNINIWSAKKKLLCEDFGGANLPPDDLAYLGSKKVCNPEELRIFHTLKARAFTLLDKYGIKFLNGWAIPENLVEEINSELAILQAEFIKQKTNFLNSYNENVQTWLDMHKDWAEIINRSLVSADYVETKLSFAWQAFKIATKNQDLETEVQNSLFDDIAKKANEIWTEVFMGKSEVSHKALSPLKTMQTKLEGLSFVEPKILAIAEIIKDTISKVSKRGKIIGQDLITLQGLVCLLKDPKTLHEHTSQLECKIDFIPSMDLW